MIKSPIQKVSDNFQNRAIGIIYGIYKPSHMDLLNKGVLTDEKGLSFDSVVLGKALPLIKKYIDFNRNYFWIVYPRNKNKENLHLQIAGIWDPSDFNDDEKTESKAPQELLKEFNLKDNYFSIRGKLIYVNTALKEFIVKISSLKSKNKSFKLIVKGEIPMNKINCFVSIEATRKSHYLEMDRFEVIETNSTIIN